MPPNGEVRREDWEVSGRSPDTSQSGSRRCSDGRGAVAQKCRIDVPARMTEPRELDGAAVTRRNEPLQAPLDAGRVQRTWGRPKSVLIWTSLKPMLVVVHLFVFHQFQASPARACGGVGLMVSPLLPLEGETDVVVDAALISFELRRVNDADVENTAEDDVSRDAERDPVTRTRGRRTCNSR